MMIDNLCVLITYDGSRWHHIITLMTIDNLCVPMGGTIMLAG